MRPVLHSIVRARRRTERIAISTPGDFVLGDTHPIAHDTAARLNALPYCLDFARRRFVYAAGVDAGEAIQKIISAPILSEGKVIGVIQISRKGSSAVEAGPDFTPDDLGKVLAICKPLGKLIRHAAGTEN